MMSRGQQEDIARILAARDSNGGEYWATPDGVISKGSPFSTLECGIMLCELQHDIHSREMEGIAGLIFKNARAKDDRRFRSAFEVLSSKLVDNMVIVENPNRKLATYNFCKKSCKSEIATRRYREILSNLNIAF